MLLTLLTISLAFFFICICCVLLNRNSLTILICIEFILLCINLLYITFSNYLDDLLGQIISLFILTVAASEVAIGLAILILFFTVRFNIKVNQLTIFKLFFFLFLLLLIINFASYSFYSFCADDLPNDALNDLSKKDENLDSKNTDAFWQMYLDVIGVYGAVGICASVCIAVGTAFFGPDSISPIAAAGPAVYTTAAAMIGITVFAVVDYYWGAEAAYRAAAKAQPQNLINTVPDVGNNAAGSGGNILGQKSLSLDEYLYVEASKFPESGLVADVLEKTINPE